MAVDGISSVEEFITQVKREYNRWNTRDFPSFRGEPHSPTPLLPRLFREKNQDGSAHDENQLLQFFRRKAPVLGLGCIPPRAEHTDEWLFLAQHVGLPTRLLDWTEGALVALYFSLIEVKDNSEAPVVWMLDPIELNRLSLPAGQIRDNEFPLTWDYRERLNIGTENFRCAWEQKRWGLAFPVAVQPTNIHPRMSSQKSCFTIHGTREECLTKLVPAEYLKKFEIDPNAIQMLKDLRVLGISHSSLFPDLDGLAKELGRIF